MRVRIEGRGVSGLTAPATLLGQNLEMAGDAAAGMLSDRLNNPKFRGPANPMTGIAQGWQPAQSNNVRGIHYELTHDMSLSGEESQLIHNFSGRPGMGILQTGRWVRQGERLEVSLWARAQHHPVMLRVGLRPLQARAAYYDQATIDVTATYWKPYQAQLTAPCDDQEAVFFCYLEGEGMVSLDQIHLRPAGSRHLARGPPRPDAHARHPGVALPWGLRLYELSLALWHGARAPAPIPGGSGLQVVHGIRLWHRRVPGALPAIRASSRRSR